MQNQKSPDYPLVTSKSHSDCGCDWLRSGSDSPSAGAIAASAALRLASGGKCATRVGHFVFTDDFLKRGKQAQTVRDELSTTA